MMVLGYSEGRGFFRGKIQEEGFLELGYLGEFFGIGVLKQIFELFCNICKVAVSGFTVFKTVNQFVIGLEGEDIVRFVVDYNDMFISVYGYFFGIYEAVSFNFGLEGGDIYQGFYFIWWGEEFQFGIKVVVQVGDGLVQVLIIRGFQDGYFSWLLGVQ